MCYICAIKYSKTQTIILFSYLLLKYYFWFDLIYSHAILPFIYPLNQLLYFIHNKFFYFVTIPRVQMKTSSQLYPC